MTEQFRRQLLATGRRMRRKGDVPPLVVIEAKGEIYFVIIGDERIWMTQPLRRETMHRLGGLLGYGVDAHNFYVLTDTWFVALPADKGLTIEAARAAAMAVGRPSEHPDRQQGLMVVEQAKDGDQEITTQVYREHGKRLQFDEPGNTPLGTTEPSKDVKWESFTFDAFWQGVHDSEDVLDGAEQIFEELFGKPLDTDEDPEVIKRRAARQMAIKIFGAEIYDEEAMVEAVKKMRRKG